MLVYNVTCVVDLAIQDEWLTWMKEIHIPEVMSTQKFISYRLSKIDPIDEHDLGNSYSVQYVASNRWAFQSYLEDAAPELKAKTLALFGSSVHAFRTTMEVLDQG